MKRSTRGMWELSCLSLASLAVLGAFGDGCSSEDPVSGRVGSATCLACHDGRSAPDRREHLEGPHDAIACEDCHGPGLLHVRRGGSTGLFIDNPASKPFEQSMALCFECHQTEFEGYESTRHFETAGASCLDCHDVHRIGGLRFSTDATAPLSHGDFEQTCAACHEEQVGDYALSGHARQEALTCQVCHDMHRPETFVQPVADNSLCLQCHVSRFLGFETDADIDLHTGPFHPVEPELTGASRCASCHLPPVTAFDEGFGPNSHTLHAIPPSVSNAAIDAGIVPVPPNSCSGVTGCHDGLAPGMGVFHDPADRSQNESLQRLFDSIGELP